jgi:transcriptional regulator with XRE-family HTH domain
MSKAQWYPTPEIERAYANYSHGLRSRVRQLMEALGLTDEELSLKMERTDSYIRQLLREGFIPRRGAIQAMARVLGVTEEYLRLGTISAAPGAAGDVEGGDDDQHDEEDEDVTPNHETTPKDGAVLPATTTAVPTERPCGAERAAADDGHLRVPPALVQYAYRSGLPLPHADALLLIWENALETTALTKRREPTAEDWGKFHAAFKDFL